MCVCVCVCVCVCHLRGSSCTSSQILLWEKQIREWILAKTPWAWHLKTRVQYQNKPAPVNHRHTEAQMNTDMLWKIIIVKKLLRDKKGRGKCHCHHVVTHIFNFLFHNYENRVIRYFVNYDLVYYNFDTYFRIIPWHLIIDVLSHNYILVS